MQTDNLGSITWVIEDRIVYISIIHRVHLAHRESHRAITEE